MITVDGVPFHVYGGRSYSYVVKCPRCGKLQGYGTDNQITTQSKRCVGCGRKFNIKGRIVGSEPTRRSPYN